MRHPDWEQRLLNAVESHIGRPFAWGENDCATLFAAAVQAITGSDPLSEWRGWSGPLTALARVRRAGCDTVQEFVASRFAPVAPSLAMRGDLGFTSEVGPLTCPAIITGAEAVSISEAGPIVFPRSLIIAAYLTDSAFGTR